jgi:hypothetical protein
LAEQEQKLEQEEHTERDDEWCKVRAKAQEISSSKVFALSIGGERFELCSLTLLSQWAEGSLFPLLFAEGLKGNLVK